MVLQEVRILRNMQGLEKGGIMTVYIEGGGGMINVPRETEAQQIESPTIAFLKHLFKESGRGCIELHGTCQSCKKPVDLIIFKNALEVEGNGGMIVGKGWEDGPEFKCSECLERDNYRISPTRCEIFTRVCGYLRPTQGFNPGKKAEFNMRTNYKTEYNLELTKHPETEKEEAS
jgi:hypothetical protein